MEVKFFVFTKKYNSTLRPTLSDGVSYECVLKSSSSVIAPTLELNYGLLVNPSQYNYCYIEAYGRYYWVQEWTFTQSYWIASLSVDVLATWRPYIGSEDMYVFRSSAEYDGKISDNKYQTVAGYSLNIQDTVIPHGKVMSSGYYIVSIYGRDSSATSEAVRYYVFNGVGFREFINKFYGTLDDDSIWSPLAKGIRNAIFDISNYIKQCWWTPEFPGSARSVDRILIGNVPILLDTDAHELDVSNTGACIRWSESFDIVNHPLASSRGSYCNLQPYSSYRLIYYPWGVIDIDPNTLYGRSKLGAEVRVEGVTGEGMLRIYAYNPPASVGDEPTDMVDIAVRLVQYMVPVPITFSQANVFGFGQNLTYEAINQTYASKSATLPLSTIHAIQGTFNLAVPTMSTSGKGGSTLTVNYERNCFISMFNNIADDDPSSNGRPLCKVRKPQNIAGYIEGESNNFSAPATESEMVEVKRFIEQGFYYE